MEDKVALVTGVALGYQAGGRSIADVHEFHVKQTIVGGIHAICDRLNIALIAEGVEKAEEYEWLRRSGISLFQGYYFARPAMEALVEVRPSLYI